jgi:hypothetical protein
MSLIISFQKHWRVDSALNVTINTEAAALGSVASRMLEADYLISELLWRLYIFRVE